MHRHVLVGGRALHLQCCLVHLELATCPILHRLALERLDELWRLDGWELLRPLFGLLI